MFKKIALSTAVLAAMVLGGTTVAHADEFDNVQYDTLNGVQFASDNPYATKTEYTVKPGDTLQTIAWKEGLVTGSLALTNHITDWNHIEVGQKLVLDYTPTIYDNIAIQYWNQGLEYY